MATKVVNVRAASNFQIWDYLRATNPSFASHTSQATANLFTERGFAHLAQTNLNALSDFFNLSVRVALQIVNISHAQDIFMRHDIGETFTMENGGIIQRMATTSVKPTSPRYKGLKDGDSVDRWTVRKPVTMERFWRQNFDYQSWITLQEYDMKQIFISEYGMAEYLAGIMQGLENGYIIQRAENKYEAIHQGLIDPNLKASQRVAVPSLDFTNEQNALQFLRAVGHVTSGMDVSAQSSAYNALGFSSTQDISRLRLLVRAGYKVDLRLFTRAGAYNPSDLDLEVQVAEVENFGGITYQLSSGTALYPAYSTKTGEVIGLNEEEGSAVATHQFGDDDVVTVDPHANVGGILMDKGWLFESIQNAYQVRPTPLNEAGLYVNYWASAPNNSINYDRLYNFVVFEASA